MATNMLKKQNKKHTEKMNNLILIREWKINLFHTTLNSHYSCRTIRKLNTITLYCKGNYDATSNI